MFLFLQDNIEEYFMDWKIFAIAFSLDDTLILVLRLRFWWWWKPFLVKKNFHGFQKKFVIRSIFCYLVFKKKFPASSFNLTTTFLFLISGFISSFIVIICFALNLELFMAGFFNWTAIRGLACPHKTGANWSSFFSIICWKEAEFSPSI